MKQKKLLIAIIAVVIIIAVVVIVGRKNHSAVAPVNEAITNENSESIVSGSIPVYQSGQLTDELFAELMARSQVGIENNDLDWLPNEQGVKFMEFLNQHGISYKALDEYASGLASDPTRSYNVDQMMQQKVAELKGQ